MSKFNVKLKFLGLVFGLGFILFGTGSFAMAQSVNQAFVVTTDFETGLFATIDLTTQTASSTTGSIHSDAVPVVYNDLVFVINRFGQDNIQIIDPSAGFATVTQYSTGNGSNPHDMAFVSADKAYISLYELSTILIVNPMTGEQLGTIDLSSLNDSDGVPEVDALHIVGNTLYASLQRLDRNNFFAPTGPSFVIAVDTATDLITDIIPVEINPFTDFVELPNGNLLLGSSGQFGVVNDGGINVIDTSNNTNSVIISDLELEGDINQIVMIDDTKGYALINDASFNTQVVSFDIDSGLKTGTVLDSQGFIIGNIAVNSSMEVYVSWRDNENPGVRIFDGITDSEITTSPIDVGLPPGPIVFLE